MDWKQMKASTTAMLTPDCEILKVTVWLFFMVCVPMTALLYIFTTLIWG